MKKKITTLSLALTAIFAISGCGGGSTTGNGGTTVGNSAFIAYSPTVSNTREVIYKTDTTPSGTSLFSNGVLATTATNYSQEVINSITLDGNYLFTVSNKISTLGCSNFFGCPETQELYILDKTTGATTNTNLTASLGIVYYATIYQVGKQNSRYIFSKTASSFDYKLDKIDTSNGATTPITLFGTDVVNTPTQLHGIAEDGDNIYFVSVDSGTHTVTNIYKLNTSNGNLADHPTLVNYNAINLFAANNKLVMFVSANNNVTPNITAGLYIVDTTSPSTTAVPISTNIFPYIDCVAKIDGKIYFETKDASDGNYYLYVLDPSQPASSALTKLETINTTVDGYVKQIFKHNGDIYYVQKSNLLKTDGATPNSAAVVVNNLAYGNVGDNKVYQANGNIYYRGYQASTGKELWVYDGTTASLAADINTGVTDSNPKT